MSFELVRIALSSLTGSRMRTALSALGIIIGIASVVAISNFGRSATSSIQDDISSQGLGVVTIIPGRDADKETERIFVRDLADEIQNELVQISTVLPVNSERFTVRSGATGYQSDVLAVDSSLFQLFSVSLKDGSYWSQEDAEEGASVAVLGDELAESLFGDENPVGHHIRLVGDGSARSLRVVGRIDTRDSAMGMDFDATVFIPFQTFKTRLRRTDRVQRYMAVIADGVGSQDASDSLKAWLTRKTGNEDSFRLMSPASLAAMLTGVTNTLNVFLTGVAAISLLVGGVGIMNIMLVSVTERIREIGIRKALGASRNQIMMQFVVEAITLTLAGGIIGVVAGVGLSAAVTTAFGWTFTASGTSIVVAIVFSSLIGLFFGWYPAARAANLDPVEALMHE